MEAKIDRSLKMSYTERYREMVEFAEFIEAVRGERNPIDRSLGLGENWDESTFRSVQVLRATKEKVQMITKLRKFPAVFCRKPICGETSANNRWKSLSGKT